MTAPYSQLVIVCLTISFISFSLGKDSRRFARSHHHSSSESRELRRYQTEGHGQHGGGDRSQWPRYNTEQRGESEHNPNNPRNTCPCVKGKDSEEYVTYDPRIQASTVEEAVLNFPDLQMAVNRQKWADESGNASTTAPALDRGFGPSASGDSLTLAGPVAKNIRGRAQPVGSGHSGLGEPGRVEASSGASETGSVAGMCAGNLECEECSAALLGRLGRAGMLQGDELDEVSKRLGVQGPARRAACDKYRFGRRRFYEMSRKTGGEGPVGNVSTASPREAAMQKLVKQLQQMGEENWAKQENSTSREKREASGKAGLSLGQRYKIDCTKRGEPVEQGSTWVGLCNVCWAWRKLPSTYFPQYLNELVCDVDTKCMSGWGMCKQRYKSVDILQNTGSDASPKWKQVTISVANYCDCEVESGSGMHNFVAA